MLERAVLIKEIDSLSPRYYNEIVDFVGYIKEKKAKENKSLEKAAEMAAEEYRNNKELTAFCALDGEDFYETRWNLVNKPWPVSIDCFQIRSVSVERFLDFIGYVESEIIAYTQEAITKIIGIG